MATRSYKEPLEITTEKVDTWFEKFSYNLIELELVVPTHADPENITPEETGLCFARNVPRVLPIA